MKRRRRNAWSVALSLTLLFSHFVNSQTGERPNVVLILADDLGFTDIAPFGSEIDTPKLQDWPPPDCRSPTIIRRRTVLPPEPCC